MPRGGKTRTSGQGRPKGARNKITKTVRDAFREAFDKVNQGASALAVWGKENPDKFYMLAAKLIPQQVEGTDDGPPVKVSVTHKVIDP